jgi:hypothetical protein
MDGALRTEDAQLRTCGFLAHGARSSVLLLERELRRRFE